MSSEKNIVKPGEASESSEDEETENMKIADSHAANQDANNQTGVVVAGEASESSSDEKEFESCKSSEESSPDKLAGKPGVEKETQNIDLAIPIITEQQTKHAHGPKYHSLLHKKLREKNVQLRSHIQSYFSDMYVTAAKDLNNIAVHAGKSHLSMRDVSHTMRLVTNDLFQLEDKVDIVATCSILPDISLPQVELPTTPS